MPDTPHKFDSYNGGLTQDGFRAVYMYMFESSGADVETIWRDLIYMGYDRSLDLLYARTCMLAFHSMNNEFELHPQVGRKGKAVRSGGVGRGGGLEGAATPCRRVAASPSLPPLPPPTELLPHPTQPFDSDAYEEAMELPIKELGKCKELEGGLVKLYTRRAGYSGEGGRHGGVGWGMNVRNYTVPTPLSPPTPPRGLLRGGELFPAVHRVHPRLL